MPSLIRNILQQAFTSRSSQVASRTHFSINYVHWPTRSWWSFKWTLHLLARLLGTLLDGIFNWSFLIPTICMANQLVALLYGVGNARHLFTAPNDESTQFHFQKLSQNRCAYPVNTVSWLKRGDLPIGNDIHSKMSYHLLEKLIFKL